MNDAQLHSDWPQACQRALAAALSDAKGALKRHADKVMHGDGHSPIGVTERSPAVVAEEASESIPSGVDCEDNSEFSQDVEEDAGDGFAHSALEVVSRFFGLSRFERDILVICAGMELDAAFPDLCAAAQPGAQRRYPTFSLALAACAGAHWSALSPGRALRYWQLIELDSSQSLVNAPLRIDERILHFLAAVQHLDERLSGFVQTADPPAALSASHNEIARRVREVWSSARTGTPTPVVQLCGSNAGEIASIAAHACAGMELRLHVMPAQVIPASPNEFDALVRLWRREAMLSGSALLLDCHGADRNDAARNHLVSRFVESAGGAMIVAGERRLAQRCLGSTITFDVAKPTTLEQRDLWEASLGESAFALNGQIDRVVSQFDMNVRSIAAACSRVSASSGPNRRGEPSLAGSSLGLGEDIWRACRDQARPQLDDLAQRVTSSTSWGELVLPTPQLRTLHDISLQVRGRATVYDAWGFAGKSSRGLGISALFAGASGTGKTLAAQVVANDLQLDLYRIDLSQVVSKYIGETEKNLRRVFDAAEEGGAVLLFDEADALFGKRSEVKDSHDRYANIEVGYLLQRMETYRGLAILTTNMKSSLDQAFMRRIRFIVQFPFPDAARRAAIWRQIFPSSTPTERLDYDRLAQLKVSGGNIHNVALGAAFLAADEGGCVTMSHLLQSAQREYAKLDRSLTSVEAKGWT